MSNKNILKNRKVVFAYVSEYWAPFEQETQFGHFWGGAHQQSAYRSLGNTKK